MMILLIGPRRLTQPFAAVLLNSSSSNTASTTSATTRGAVVTVDGETNGGSTAGAEMATTAAAAAAAVTITAADPVDDYAVAALQRHVQPHPLLRSQPQQNVRHHNNDNQQQQPVHVHMKEPPDSLFAAADKNAICFSNGGIADLLLRDENPGGSFSTSSWDHIIYIVASSAAAEDCQTVWDRRDIRTLTENVVSPEDLWMQRMTLVVAIGNSSSSSSTTDNHNATNEGHLPTAAPIAQRTHANRELIERDGLAENAAAPATASQRSAPSSTARAAASDATATEHQQRHMIRPGRKQLRLLVPIFSYHEALAASLHSAARMAWKRSLLAQRMRYEACSPLVLCPLLPSRRRKRKAAAA